MQLDLKNVRVTYSIREVVAVVAVIAALAGHVIRTEIQNINLGTQVSTLRADVDNCKQQLKEAQMRARK